MRATLSPHDWRCRSHLSRTGGVGVGTVEEVLVGVELVLEQALPQRLVHLALPCCCRLPAWEADLGTTSSMSCTTRSTITGVWVFLTSANGSVNEDLPWSSTTSAGISFSASTTSLASSRRVLRKSIEASRPLLVLETERFEALGKLNERGDPCRGGAGR